MGEVRPDSECHRVHAGTTSSGSALLRLFEGGEEFSLSVAFLLVARGLALALPPAAAVLG